MADIIFNRLKVLIKEHSSGEVVEDVTPDVVQANWTFKRAGGVESFSVALRRDSSGIGGLTCPIVEIWLQDTDNSWTLAAAGYAIRLYPLVGADRQPMLTIEGVGYLQQLRWVQFSQTWENTDIDDIVNDIIDNTVAGWTGVGITRHTGKTTAGSGTSHVRLEWNGTAYDVIMHLAEILGGVEWGVAPFLISGTWYPAKFYFVAASSTVNHYFWKHEMASVDYEFGLGRIANYLVLRGDAQQATGDALSTTEEDATSQTDYGKRAEIIENTLIDNATDAATYLQALEGVFKDPARGLAFRVKNRTVNDRLEANCPMGTVRTDDLFFDAQRSWYVNAVTYVAQRDGKLDMEINCGEKLGVRRIYPPAQHGGMGAQPGMKMLPFYGRGGYTPLNPNFHKIDWSRTGPGGWYYPKEYWKMQEKNKSRARR